MMWILLVEMETWGKMMMFDFGSAFVLIITLESLNGNPGKSQTAGKVRFQQV
jgi:hypothetical protein